MKNKFLSYFSCLLLSLSLLSSAEAQIPGIGKLNLSDIQKIRSAVTSTPTTQTPQVTTDPVRPAAPAPRLCGWWNNTTTPPSWEGAWQNSSDVASGVVSCPLNGLCAPGETCKAFYVGFWDDPVHHALGKPNLCACVKELPQTEMQ